LTDQAVIIEAMVRTIKASNLPRGLMWCPLEERVQKELGCSKAQFEEAFFVALDQCIVEEREPGWVRVVDDPEAMRKADDAKLERHMEDQVERDQQLAREHDYARQHSAEGR
jgi:hypothetical protein